MDITNEKLLQGARNLKNKGFSQQQVDNWLKSKGSSLDDMRSFVKQQNQPQFSEDALAQVRANNEAYAQRQEEARPWIDKNLGGRLAVAGMQGVANSALNPAGYAARAAGMDTKPFTSQNGAERAMELGSGYAFDAAILGGLGKIAQGAGYLGKGQGVASKVAQEVLAPENTTALLSRFVAPAAGGGIVEGITNPQTEVGKFLANMTGAGAVGSLEGGIRKTITPTKGGLKNALANDEANAALSDGIKADKTKGVARQINKEAPAVYNELNAEMSQALDDATGRKLNIRGSLDNQKQRYDEFMGQNANKEVISQQKTEIPTNAKQNAPTLAQLKDGLSKDQTKVLDDVIKEGADKVTNPKGSLRAVHRALEVLNKRIDNVINENPLRPRSTEDPDVKDLMQVKSRLNQALEYGGIKPYDASISKAKRLRDFYETGYNFKPSETKFENIGLKTYRDRRAFLQGRLAKLQDNVLSDGGTNLATTIKKDENTLRKLMPKSKFETLMNKADKIEENFKQLKSIQGQADKEVLKKIERGSSPWRENIESRGSMLGRALDIATGWYGRGAKTNLANQYLNPETQFITRRGGLLGMLKGSTAADTRQLMIDLLNGGK